MKYNYKDIGMTEEYNEETGQWEPGDIMLSPPSLDYNLAPMANSVDIQKKRSYDNLRQTILFRFLTKQGDYQIHKDMGHTLWTISGRRMTKELIENGKILIKNLLTYDNFIDAADIDITGIPLDNKTLLYNIAINVGEIKLYKFNISYSADTGEWTLQ